MLSIIGPTAAGKTRLSIEIAQKIGGEIISADSMQVYRGMDIGTAKPTIKERRGIPHYLIDIRDPDEEWTVSDFIEEAGRLVSSLSNPILVGGTGLYLWAFFEGFSFPIAEADPALRDKLNQQPLDKLYQKLKEVDPAAAEKIHANDRKRIIRALEVFELTGQPISKLQKKGPPLPSLPPPLIIGIDLTREELYKRIDSRVDQMIEKGLIEEVRELLAKGYSKELRSFQALGYKEACEYIDGNWTREMMIEELKKRTRRFARRQLTWFKRFKNVKWFNAPVDTRTVLDYINSI